MVRYAEELVSLHEGDSRKLTLKHRGRVIGSQNKESFSDGVLSS